MQELDTAYRTLDLEPGASMEEVNQAYKDLVFIWHPDRLPKDNLRLIEKAQEKIKQLNQARDYLRTHARVGTASTSTGNGAGYRQRSHTYGRPASSSQSYRQRSPYDRAQETNQQTYQNPYRARQSRYAQTGYGGYGAYRRPESSESSSRHAAAHESASASSNGDKAAGPAYRHRPPYGSSAPRSNTNDGWNNYTTAQPSGSGNAASNSRSTGPSYTVNSERSHTSRYRSAPSETTSSSSNTYRSRQQHPDLSGSNFSGANLRERDFSGRNLSSADLTNADLQDAFLHGVNLNRANLSNANLFRANLLQANLSHANLRGANLIGADLSGADLSGADLSGAKVAVGDRVMVKLTGTILRATIMPDGTINA
ncbi:MAG: pentapeptide repeat-containing protein [Leptolyngbyaceae cyanobacterium]